MSQKFTWKAVKTGSDSIARPSPRWGHSSCVVNDQIILFGGYANSIYMNDLWTFNTLTMEWTEVKTSGQVPNQRSNCSLNYDSVNNRLILFGGGGENKRRYNEINFLNWETKEWTRLAFAENETAPWERTYHSAQLLYPYLITFGGEGIADLDDLWVFNLETSKWQEVIFGKEAVRPCGRRFHTSCLIGNEFYVIAGCYSKYRPLSDVFSINLTKLKETGTVEGLEWKERLNDQGFLTRWGQSSAVQGNNIYIFGGRFSNDLNDILVLNTEKNKIKVMKVATDTVPKPRRRSCLNFVGNCLVMFGGFNSDYYNDLHYINVGEMSPKPKIHKANSDEDICINCQNVSDLKITSNTGKKFDCHKGIFMQYFKTESKLSTFFTTIEQKQNDEDLTKMIEDLYRGYGNSRLLVKYMIELPETAAEKEAQFMKIIQSLRTWKKQESLSTTSNYHPIKLSEYEYRAYIEQYEQNMYKDITMVFRSCSNNEYYSTSLNMVLLMRKSKYFRNLLVAKYQKSKEDFVMIQLPLNVNKMQIILVSLMTGYLVVPQTLTPKQWMDLYRLADYFSLHAIQNQILYQLYSLISDPIVDPIFQFAQQYNLQDLALACTQYMVLNNCKSKISMENKYYQISEQLNRFQIKQDMMTKNIPFVCKKKNSSTEDMEEEKENNVEACRY